MGKRGENNESASLIKSKFKAPPHMPPGSALARLLCEIVMKEGKKETLDLMAMGELKERKRGEVKIR